MQAKHESLYVEVMKASEPKKGTRQATLTEMTVPASKLDKIVSAGLRWMIKDFQPFSVFDSDAFREFLSTCSPMLKPPCSATIRAKLPLFREELAGQIHLRMSTTMDYGCLTLDSWTSAANRPYMGITIQWLDQEFGFNECALEFTYQPYPHTAQNAAGLIRKSDEWDYIHTYVYLVDVSTYSLGSCMDR